jgi:Dolichyl-phosphate-mannose-protein mannosyltransferase
MTTDIAVPGPPVAPKHTPMEATITEQGSQQMRSSRVGRAPLRSLLWAVLMGFAVRLIVVAFAYNSFLDPQREHWLFGFEIGKIAQSLVLGHGFGNIYYGGPTGPTAQIAPVLPYILAGIFAVFGIYTKAAAIAMLALNSILSAFTCVPIYFIAKRSFGVRVARWATWAWAFFPYAIYFSADSMWDHALVALLLTCTLWAALALLDSKRKISWVGFGLLCGFSALVNPVVLGVVPVLGAWVCYRRHQDGRAWRFRALTAAAVTCAVIAPWLIRNYRVFHAPVFLKDDLPLELCAGNVGDSLYWWNPAIHPSGSAAQMIRFHRMGEQAYMAANWSSFANFLEHHPGIYARRSVRRFVYVWTGYWSLNARYLQEEEFDLADIPFRTGLTLLALFGLFRIFREHPRQAAPYALMLIFFPVVFYLTHPEIAYRDPIDPEIVILACCALTRLRRRQETVIRLETDVPDSSPAEYLLR